jgi:A/G-specific adenine glycosylase
MKISENFLIIDDILKLKGVGKYTAAAVASICFDEKIPAIDGNFYRVLSRIFADDFDISSSKAYQYFYNLAMMIMPEEILEILIKLLWILVRKFVNRRILIVKFVRYKKIVWLLIGKGAKFPVKSKK